jgi:hypothetical protein
MVRIHFFCLISSILLVFDTFVLEINLILACIVIILLIVCVFVNHKDLFKNVLFQSKRSENCIGRSR